MPVELLDEWPAHDLLRPHRQHLLPLPLGSNSRWGLLLPHAFYHADSGRWRKLRFHEENLGQYCTECGGTMYHGNLPKFLSRSFLMLRFACLLLLAAVLPAAASAQTPASAFNRDPWPAAKEGPIKVFILAGQSNMQGQASLRNLEYLI